MKDLAYKIIGLDTLWSDAMETDDEDAVWEWQFELALNAGALARIVAELPDNPVTHNHTRLAEIRQYADLKQVCVEHAIVDLVNIALSDGALSRITEGEV